MKSGNRKLFSRKAATAIGFAAILMWAFLALLSAGAGAIPPFELAAMAFLVGGLAGAVSWPFRPGSVRNLRQPLLLWLLGVGGLFGYHFAYFSAIQSAPPVQVSLIAYLWPLFLVVFSAFLPGETLKRHHGAGVVLGLAGAALVIAGDPGFSLAGGVMPGHVLAFACALIWAGYSVLMRHFGRIPTDVVAGFCLASAGLALVCHGLFETTVWPGSVTQAGAILALGLAPMGLAFYAWDTGIKQGDIMVLGALSYAAPVLSTLLLVVTGVAVFRWSLPLACALIAGGGLLAARDMIFPSRAAPDPALMLPEAGQSPARGPRV